jgi:hypothetical protein
MRYLFFYLLLCVSVNAAETCKIEPAVVCNSIPDLLPTAKAYAEAVKNLGNTIVTIPNLAISGKLDVQEAQDIVKKIEAAASECGTKKADVTEIIADLKKLESKIRNTDLVLQKITPSDNAALTKAREDALKQSNHLLALLVRMNESNALKVKTLCKEETSDKDESEDEEGAEEDSDSEENDDESDAATEDGDSSDEGDSEDGEESEDNSDDEEEEA